MWSAGRKYSTDAAGSSLKHGQTLNQNCSAGVASAVGTNRNCSCGSCPNTGRGTSNDLTPAHNTRLASSTVSKEHQVIHTGPRAGQTYIKGEQDSTNQSHDISHGLTRSYNTRQAFSTVSEAPQGAHRGSSTGQASVGRGKVSSNQSHGTNCRAGRSVAANTAGDTKEKSKRCRCGGYIYCYCEDRRGKKIDQFITVGDSQYMGLSREETAFISDSSMPGGNQPTLTGSTTTPQQTEGTSPTGAMSLSQPTSVKDISVKERQRKFRNHPTNPLEQILAKYSLEIIETAADDGQQQDCSICMSALAEESSYQTAQDSSRDIVGSVSLSLCSHVFHTACLKQMVSLSNNSLACPNCNTIHGVRTGTQPEGGRMTVTTARGSLPGFERTGTIQIAYSFPGGMQGPEHPSPGRPYYLIGFPRIAYLPNTEEGNKVLRLLHVAFERRLVFTVGTSSTNGMSDNVIWNGIHHKTEMQNYGGHGYPDPNYLSNVTMELVAVGVTDADLQ